MFRKRAWVAVAVMIGGAGLYGLGRWSARRAPAVVDVAAMRPFFMTFVVPEQHGDATWVSQSMQTVIGFNFDLDHINPIERGENVVRPGWFFRVRGAAMTWENIPGDGSIGSGFTGIVDGYRAEYRNFENEVPWASFSFFSGKLVEARNRVVTMEFRDGKLWRMTCANSSNDWWSCCLNADGRVDSYSHTDRVRSPTWESGDPVLGRTDEFFGSDGTMEETIERTADGKLVYTCWRNNGRDWQKYFDEAGVFVRDWDAAVPGPRTRPATTN